MKVWVNNEYEYTINLFADDAEPGLCYASFSTSSNNLFCCCEEHIEDTK